MQCDFDILVIGGGLVGASFACALAGSGRSVCLVEARPFSGGSSKGQPSFDERTTAVAWGSRCLLERWQLWAGIADAAAPIRNLHVSQRGRFGAARVTHRDYGVDALGYVVPNRVLGGALFDRIGALETVALLAPMRFQGLAYEDGAIVVTVRGADDGEQTLRARLVVGADGVGSRVRSALGIAAKTTDYGQSAIVTTVGCDRDFADLAFERFTPDGPIALLPHPGGARALVWTLPGSDAGRRRNQPPASFLADLQAAFGYRAGQFHGLGERSVYPLTRLVCPRPVAARAVLVGNAGHNLHPAAAQGFNLALRDVAALAALIAAAGPDADPGDARLLAAWWEARRADQRRVSDFTDAIVRVFSSRVPGLGLARGLGLVGLELFPQIKHDMARRSMGLAAVGEGRGH